MTNTIEETDHSMGRSAEFETAVNWAARQMLGGLNSAEDAELKTWLSESDDRRAQYEEAVAAWNAPETLLAAALMDEPQGRTVSESWSSKFKSFWTRNWKIAAPVGGVAVSFGLALLISPMIFSSSNTELSVQIAQAPIAETSTIALTDGTSVTLERDTRLEFKDDGKLRSAKLGNGEAFFKVARNEARPFVIDANGAEIRVLGTEFNVNSWDGGVSVTVLEGRVAFRDASGMQSVELTAGQGANILNSSKMHTFTFDVENYADWRTGWVDAIDMPLDEVLAKLGRYAGDKISAEKHEIDAFLVTGRFQLSQTESTLQTLALLYGLQIENTPGKIVLSADKPRETTPPR